MTLPYEVIRTMPSLLLLCCLILLRGTFQCAYGVYKNLIRHSTSNFTIFYTGLKIYWPKFIFAGLDFFVAVWLRTSYFVDVTTYQWKIGSWCLEGIFCLIFKGLEVLEHLQTLADEDTIFLRNVNRLASDKISGTDHPVMGVMSPKKRFFSFIVIFLSISTRPIPVAAQPKTSVCCRTFAGMVGSNPAGGMDVCLLWLLCVVTYRSLRRVDHSSRWVILGVVCLSVISKLQHWEDQGPLGLARLEKKICIGKMSWNILRHCSNPHPLITH